MRGFFFGGGLVLSCGGIAGAAVDYARDIKPLIAERCLACHGALKQKAGLRLDTVAAMRLGGKAGDVLKGSHAMLLSRVMTTDLDDRMPPEGEGAAFTAAQVALLKEWIALGAPGPVDEVPEADPGEHWAYHAPVASAGTMDDLLEVKRSAKGVKAVGVVAPGLWLRRVSLDLIGLPPTVEEIRDLENEMSGAADPQAVRRRVVERLLARPQYGERWARHFMDIWRYSDWYGLGAQLRYSHKHLWHWRDWMVESLNADKGYDEMVMQMLAADEMDPEDADNLRATGFLARSYYLFNRTTWLDATIEHTSRAFLGLTMQCVKCHDHKYDPVDHEEYYRMRAIFEPMHVRLDAVPGVTDFEKDGLPRVFDLHVERATYRHVRGNEANVDKSKAHAPGVPRVLAWDEFKVEPIKLPVVAARPGMRRFLLEDHLRVAEAERLVVKERVWRSQGAEESRKAEARLKLELEAAELKPEWLKAVDAAERKGRKDDEAKARAASLEARHGELMARMALMKVEADPALRGDKEKAKAEAEKRLAAAKKALVKAQARLAKPGLDYTPLKGALKAQEGPDDASNAAVQRFPETSTGRRLAFARWVTDQRHPLTARVLVNQVWLRHFGTSLVEDVTDFGRRTKPPVQQAVLDTLAVRFMESGWSLKALHREMVLSDLYAMTSSQVGAEATTLAADPDNTLYWRMNARRMESQVVRDSLLHVSGQLDLTMGGPTVDPVKAERGTRRALYFNQTAFDQHRFLGGFDNANVVECYRREVSVMPQQALALSNSRESADCAAMLAKRFAELTDVALVREAFVLILGREPSAAEQSVCEAALKEMKRELFLQGLLNHNDFITVR
jgi:hypothetical protein